MIDYSSLLSRLKGVSVERPNKQDKGTLSGHAAGEPFEKAAYRILKSKYPTQVFKQFEFLNDIYLKNPKCISLAQRNALIQSPTVLFLLTRGDKATINWNPENVFEEKQNDTADIIFLENDRYSLIDIKTKNALKASQPPNIISAYKLAKMCANMLDNEDFESFSLNYIEIEWIEKNEFLECSNAYYANLFKATPKSLYINWAAALQIQFFVSSLDQSFGGTRKIWCQEYLRNFVESALRRCEKTRRDYITPFLKYL